MYVLEKFLIISSGITSPSLSPFFLFCLFVCFKQLYLMIKLYFWGSLHTMTNLHWE